MMKHRLMHSIVTTNVIHPPSLSFSLSMTTRIDMQSTNPVACTGRCFFQCGSVLRWRIQNRTMPISDREKVAKTLMLYMTTRMPMLPPQDRSEEHTSELQST